MSEPIYPFVNGVQWGDWQACNCDRCAKSNLGDDGWAPDCPILNALFTAQMDGSGMPEEIARRMGYLDHPGAYVWLCGEVQWTEEWREALARWKATK